MRQFKAQFSVALLTVSLLAVLLHSCSSADDEYQYQEGNVFETQSSNLSKNEANSQNGAYEYNEQGTVENAPSDDEASNNNLGNYENLLTEENENGADINNAANDDVASDDLDNNTGISNNIGTELTDYNTSANPSDSANNLLGVNPSLVDNDSTNNLQPAAEPAAGAIEDESVNDVMPVNDQVPEFYEPNDVLPSFATLWWVGYNYQKEEKKLYIEVMTKGEPQYEIFQEMNQSGQPELVLRLLSTVIRSKLRRDIDASEFRSPVAFVRMREDSIEGHTDVVLTMRDAAKPRFFAKDGRFLFTYAIPEKYLGPSIANNESKEEAMMAELVGTEDVSPSIDGGSDLPKSQQVAQRPSNTMDVPRDEGVVLDNVPVSNEYGEASIPSPEQMPANFTQSESNVVSTVIPDAAAPQEPVASNVVASNVAVNSENIEGNSSSTELPSVPAPPPVEQPIQKVQPGGNVQYYPQSFQSPYTQPYQNRYSPYSGGSAYQQPSYQQPYYQQPTYQAAPPASPPAEGQQPAATPVEENSGGNEEIEGSGFDNDDSLDNFDVEGDEDAIEKFEVHNDIEWLNTRLINAVAQYGEPAVEDFAAYENTTTNYGGSADYNYEANTIPAAEVTELNGSDTPDTPQSFDGKLISLEFHNASIANVLKAFTDQTGINFVFPALLTQNLLITVKLRDVPWDAALKAILDANNLAMIKVTDTIIKIDSNANISLFIRQQNLLKREQSQTLPTRTLVFRLSYADATAVVPVLTQLLRDPNNILPTPNVSSDERTNSVIVEGISQILSKAKAMIERMDTPTLQAEIAARIVEVSKTAQDFLGVTWGAGFNYDAGRGLGFGSLNFPNNITSQYSIDAGSTNPIAGDYRFRFGSINGILDLDLRLQMEEQLSNSETLQSQKIIVQDGGTATILSGKTDRFQPRALVGQGGQDAGQGGGQELQQVDINVTLTITELKISNDSMVTLPVEIVSQSQAPPAGSSVISNFERRIQTTLVSRTGETVVIGGASAATKTKTTLGVPFFSKLPIIGALFRQTTNLDESKDLLVMLTPNILSSERNGTSEIGTIPSGTMNAGGGNNASSQEYNNYGNNATNNVNNTSGNNSENANYNNYGNEEENDSDNANSYENAESASNSENNANYNQAANQEAVNNEYGNENQEAANENLNQAENATNNYNEQENANQQENSEGDSNENYEAY